jgi:hypothetical protein
MSVIEASFSGTFRTIVILVVIWLVLRWFLRLQRAKGPSVHRGPVGPERPKGEVRIENVPPPKSTGERPGGTIIDADFEEIK